MGKIFKGFCGISLGFSILWACAWGQLKFRVILAYKFHIFLVIAGINV